MHTASKTEIAAHPRIPATMRAAVYRGKDDVRLETVAVPEIGPGEALVRIHTCGICGTDLNKISTGSHSAPPFFGPSMLGETMPPVAGDAAGTNRNHPRHSRRTHRCDCSNFRFVSAASYNKQQLRIATQHQRFVGRSRYARARAKPRPRR